MLSSQAFSLNFQNNILKEDSNKDLNKSHDAPHAPTLFSKLNVQYTEPMTHLHFHKYDRGVE